MIIEAPFSKHRKNTYIIWMVVLAAFAGYCVYDGYFNEKFIQRHSDADGKADSTLLFNRKSPPFLVAAAVLLGGYLLVVKNRKITAEESELVINNRRKITYDSIQKIDKTYFDSKGHFTVTYKNDNGSEVEVKFSDRTYDNLGAILEHLVAKIS